MLFMPSVFWELSINLPQKTLYINRLSADQLHQVAGGFIKLAFRGPQGKAYFTSGCGFELQLD